MMGKKSRRPKGGGRRGTPNSKVAEITRHLLEHALEYEKLRKEHADGTLTLKTLRTAEPTLRTAVARGLGVDEELIKDAVNHTLLTHFLDKKGLAAAREKLDNDLVRAQIAQLKAENAELRADEISRAMARAKATAKATPRERYAANPQFCNAISNLIDTIGRYEEDVEDFKEFLNSIKRRTYPSPTQCVETIARWPRLRKYWPRLRRRICSYCGKGTFDLSAPRLLVCGGCDQGRGVGRYCSEDCQRAHWPEHQKPCMKLHEVFEDESERDAYLGPFMKDLRQCKEKGLTLEEYLALGGTEAERLRLAMSDSA